ncbi:hypothetical protein P7K49_014759, partial [Saguinus oedipus]
MELFLVSAAAGSLFLLLLFLGLRGLWSSPPASVPELLTGAEGEEGGGEESVIATRVPMEPHATKEGSCCTPRGPGSGLQHPGPDAAVADHAAQLGSAPRSRFQGWLEPTPINEEEDSL